MSGQPYIISLVLLLTVGKFSTAQNLVPNPGFELMNDCNFPGYSITGGIANWFTFDYMQNTVDVLHTCLASPQLHPPNTVRGYSYPHAGNGMIGLAYAKESNYYEVGSVKLSIPLVKDSAYCVSFWVKNSKIENMLYWVEYVGLLFTEDTVTPYEIHYFNPHIKSHQDLSLHDWIEVSGYYIANGTERYANIGFFGPSIAKYQNKPYQQGTNFLPFYFFDDVTVVPCNKDSLLSVYLDLPNVFTVDGNGVNDEYFLKQNNIKKLNVQVFNRWGNVVREYDGTKEVWNGTDNSGLPLTEGVYFVKAVGETTFGDVVQKTQFVHLIRP